MLRLDLIADEPRDVLVRLADADDDEAGVGSAGRALSVDLGGLPADEAAPLSDELVEQRAEQYEQLQERVLGAISADDSLVVLHRYENFPFLFMNVSTLQGLRLLAAQPEVAQIYADERFEHQLSQSLAAIHQPAVQASGKLGANTSVAVLDTGCDYQRSAFGSCSTPGASGCKVAFARDFAPSDGALDDNGHGTNVSAIVLGVAPSTKVLALDVFAGLTAPGSAILKAIDWTIQNRVTYNIVAMNLSLGGSSFSSVCSNDFFASALGNARSAGILASVASGNGGLKSAISSPACVPAAISVGAVYDANVGGLGYSGCSDPTTAADKVACFSNSASFMSMLAPGAPITAAGITMTGTSQAAPHVAGALAVLRAASPSESLDDLVTRITTSGPAITDPRNGITKHRLDLLAALSAAGVDTTPPSGSVSIDNGALATRSGSVSLSISARDSVAVTSVCVSNTTVCTSFSAFSTLKPWVLTTGDGVKTVYVSLRDAAGNVTRVADTIVRDAMAPGNAVLTASAGNARADLSWSAATDAGSGVAGYRVVYGVGASPGSCAAGTLLYSGRATAVAHTGAVNGTTYGYRLCTLDAAGNASTGTITTARPLPERDAPVGTVSIQNGDAYTRATAVALSISAGDAGAVTSMCISNTATKCVSFRAFATTTTWTLSTAGTVYVWFRDSWGNTSTTPVSDSILLDKVAPSMSPLNGAPAPGLVALSWSPAADSGSGVAGYKLAWARGTTAPSCTSGALAYAGSLTSHTLTGLTTGKYSFRLCASDRAGNLSTGVIRIVTVP